MMPPAWNHREHVIPALTDHLEDEAGRSAPLICLFFVLTKRRNRTLLTARPA
jgi:hypothetical protein